MDGTTLETYRAIAYTAVTALLVVLLYAYIVNLYIKQKNGAVDYEKYADLALKDSLNDDLIEPREKGTKQK